MDKNEDAGAEFDLCGICGEDLDLSQLHSFDRDIDRPVHSTCVKAKHEIKVA